MNYSNIYISEGSAVADLRRGGRFYFSFLCSLSFSVKKNC